MPKTNKVIAVTGSSGFIGKKLLEKIKKFHNNVIELDKNNGFDLIDWKKCSKVPHFDVIIHLASSVYVPESFNKPREYYNNNINSTLNVLELCRINKAKIIFSSSYVYGKPVYLPIDELHPVESLNPYNSSKILSEKMCTDYNRFFGTEVIILRPSNIYGPGQDSRFLIPSIIKQAKSGSIKLENPEPKRDFIYVDDVIDAYIKALDYEPEEPEIFNIASGMSYSVKEIVNIVTNNLHQSITVDFNNVIRKNEILDTIEKNEKAKQILKWKPKINIEAGILNCLVDYENSML